MSKKDLQFNETKIWEYLFRHAFVSKQYKLLYVATPKVACTSLKWWFASLEGYSPKIFETAESIESNPDLVVHDLFPVVAPGVTGLKAEDLATPMCSDEYFRFAVVRNPYKRIFSAWQSKLLMREPLQSAPYIKYDFFWMPIKNAHDIASAFEAFLVHLVSQEAPNYMDDHWTPQVTILRPDIISYTKLVQIENPKKLTAALGNHLGPNFLDPFLNYHKNESLIPYSPRFFTKKAVALIQSLYKEDFQIFGYDNVMPSSKYEFSSQQLDIAIQAIHLVRGRHNRLAQIRTALSSQITNLNHAVFDQGLQIDILRQTIEEQDHLLQHNTAQMAESDIQIDILRQTIQEQDHLLQHNTAQMAESDIQINSLRLSMTANIDLVQRLTLELANRDTQIASLNQSISEKSRLVNDISMQLTGRDIQIADLNKDISEQQLGIQELQSIVEFRDNQITNLIQTVTNLEEHRTQLLLSNSWKLTRPIRFVARCLKYQGITPGDRNAIIQKLRVFSKQLSFLGKYRPLLSRLFIRITGWTVTVPENTKPRYFDDFQEANTALSIPSDMAKQISNPYSHIIPFFGPRNQYGKRRAAILTNMLLDWNDGHPRFGGGERYALEIACLLQELGIDVTFFQPSYRGFGEGEYFGFPVRTFPPSDSYGEFHYSACTYFTNQTMGYDHVYYHLPEYASGVFREDGLLTCHGIWFDHNNYPGSFFRTSEWFRHLFRAFANPNGIVSVDTHSISFIRDIWPELSDHITYLPNFFDKNKYKPDNSKRRPEKLTVLFPRRAQINRGSRIFPQIVANIPYELNIEWIGEGDDVDMAIIKEVCAKDKRVKFGSANFDEMPARYQHADIVVIPSIASEGTSLSCIEALASGCAVIATNVGGLSDLIHDGVNGLLVDPNYQSISNAINYLVENNLERQRLQNAAPESIAFLELTHWRSKWTNFFLKHGWIDNQAYDLWRTKNTNSMPSDKMHPSASWVIFTRNAIHGGVESIIREQSKMLNAPVVVCGGLDEKDVCPFDYIRADSSSALRDIIRDYDVILYHWLPNWALDVIKESGKICIEFVHRIDTCDNDKSIPSGLLTHSKFLAEYVAKEYGNRCRIIEHPIDTALFVPSNRNGTYIGAITSYYDTKGIDIFLRAWSIIQQDYPELHVRFYGSGDQRSNLEALATRLGVLAEFCPPTKTPWKALLEYKCFVLPSRVEGFPMAVLEALAMNIPVVASDLPGVLEFNANAISRGFLPYIHTARSQNVSDFANAIRQTLENKNNFESRDYISKYFSLKKHLDNLLNSKVEFTVARRQIVNR